MAASFLHGAEVEEVDTGTRPIRTAPAGIIGIVGTAHYADASAFPLNTPVLISGSRAEAAKLVNVDLSTLSESELEGDIIGTLPEAVEYILQQTGARIVVVRVAAELTDPTAATLDSEAGPFALVDGQTLLVAVDGGAPATATFNTADFVDIGAATADEVAAVIATDIPGVTASVAGGAVRISSAPTGVTSSLEVTGGTANAALGFSSTEVTGVDAAYDAAATLPNVVGGVNGVTGAYEGITALLAAEQVLGQRPRILCVPGFSHEATVQTALKTILPRLRAIAWIDGPNTTDAAALAAADAHDDRRLMLVDPGVIATAPSWAAGVVEDDTTAAPASSFAAGVHARTVDELGFWVSPSNKIINGVVGLQRPVDFAFDANSRANVLNEGNVATIIRHQGFRLWGNRTLSSDAQWAFVSVVMTADSIDDAILSNHLWAIDRGITKTYFEEVAEGVKAYLSQLRAEGAIIDGTCWPDEALNTPTSIAAGRAYWNFDFAPSYPGERLTFRRLINNDYLEALV